MTKADTISKENIRRILKEGVFSEMPVHDVKMECG